MAIPNTKPFSFPQSPKFTFSANTAPRDSRLSRKRWDNQIKEPFSGPGEIPTAGLAVTPDQAKKFQNEGDLKGVPSIMNSFSLTTLGVAENQLLFDKAQNNKWYEDKNTFTESLNDSTGFANNATTDAIIKNAETNDPMGKRPYTFSDFVFCKYWNKIPNNRLITLRRYGLPVNDALNFAGEADGSDTMYSPVAQAITYIGEEPENSIANLLGFKSGVPWKDIKAEVWEVSQDKPHLDASGTGIGNKLSRMAGMLTGAADADSIIMDGALPPDPYTDGPYNNVIQGPVNRIDQTKGREAGIMFEQSITLNFHYIARPMGGINTKAVMLDILGNLLVLTGAEAAFWGGMHRFRIGKPKYPFAGGLLGPKGESALLSGDADTVFDSFTQNMGAMVDGFADAITNLFSGGSIKDILGKGLKLGAARKFAGKKPFLQGYKALLTGNPVGEWHLTVGNPLNPMLEMGNMVCTGMDIKFSEELGPDDFPLELKATITLEHGMPRDIAAIQAMFNRGKGKIYTISDDIQWLGATNAKQPAVDVATASDNNQGLGQSTGRSNYLNTKHNSTIGSDAAATVRTEIAHTVNTAMGYAKRTT